MSKVTKKISRSTQKKTRKNDLSRKAEENLIKEHEQIKAILLSIDSGLIVVDKKREILILNKKAENLLKITSAKAVGKNLKSAITTLKNKKEKFSIDKWPINKVLKKKESVKINAEDEFYFRNKLGKIFPVKITLTPFFFNDNVSGIIIIFQDITKAKLMKEKVEFSHHNLKSALKSIYLERDNFQKEKNKLEATLNSIGDAVLAIDRNKKVVIFNSVAEKITGLKLKKMENCPFGDCLKLINETTKTEEVDIIKKALKGKVESNNSDLAIIVKNKKTISVDINASPIRDRKGKINGCIVVFRDVTEKREIERMRSDFISIVSHQLRTPLSAVKWFLEILSNGDVGALQEKQIELVKEIHDSNESMINFINQMLNISRTESGHLAVDIKTLNLDNCIKEIIRENSGLIKSKKQKFKFIGAKDKSLKVRTDKSMLRNIIGNLITNASEYTGHSGNISLTIEKGKENDLLFKIVDDGIGIPQKEQQKIFKRFSRASNAIKYKANGTGIGLYITKLMTDMLGGKIWFESKKDKGTSFFLILPIRSTNERSCCGKDYCKFTV